MWCGADSEFWVFGVVFCYLIDVFENENEEIPERKGCMSNEGEGRALGRMREVIILEILAKINSLKSRKDSLKYGN